MRIAIIGGGAAGMMAAATINEQNPNHEVIIVEKNELLGKKVLISGGGRCNVTTGYTDVHYVLTKYPRGAKFLTGAMHHFSPSQVFDWFEDHAAPLKREDDMRVFPESDDGADIVGVFEKIFSNNKTVLLYKHAVKQLTKQDNGFVLTFKDDTTLAADKVVLALGGQAFRQTGSTGDGYTLAEGLGHHITTLAASLHSFITKEKFPRQIAGVSFEEATITVHGSKKYSFTGPFLFTHTGISGPAVFAVSSLAAFETCDQKLPLRISIDVLPSINEEALLEKLKATIHLNPKKAFKNTLGTLVPQSLADVICAENAIMPEHKNAEVSSHELALAISWLKHLPLHAIGRGAGDEFVTAGGVDTREVDPRTMESKLCPGLYFAGEILDIDGFTGGFNLQASWATGHAAGGHLASLS